MAFYGPGFEMHWPTTSMVIKLVTMVDKYLSEAENAKCLLDSVMCPCCGWWCNGCCLHWAASTFSMDPSVKTAAHLETADPPATRISRRWWDLCCWRCSCYHRPNHQLVDCYIKGQPLIITNVYGTKPRRSIDLALLLLLLPLFPFEENQ